MPPTVEEDKETTAIKPTIGIIYPPPELKNIVDKTASFVARNGPEFETRIRKNEINNKKFNFLNIGDPYNAYYNHKVKEFKEGKGATEPAPSVAPLSVPKYQPTLPAEVAKAVEPPQIPREPPPEYEFMADPPSISAINLDVVKLTAQFVARNGRQFLTNLMNREQRNFHFDFLRPEHSLFTYFTKLLEHYTKILIPPKDLMNKLKKEAENPQIVLDQVKARVEWIKHQEAIRRREEEEAERERVQYAQIDWHDFVVVETVDYQPNEQGLFPPPTTPNDVGSRVLALERYDDNSNVNEDVEMDMESDEEQEPSSITATSHEQALKDLSADKKKEAERTALQEEMDRAPSPPPLPPKEAPPLPPPLPPQPDHVLIRKDYNPKANKKPVAAPTTGQFLISPITGEKIPAEKMQEHMRIGLLDPRWVEQRDKALQEKVAQEEVFAIGSSIESSLKHFAERRTDIFGIGVEETAIGKKIGEEDRKAPEKVTWDGHTASVEAATMKARANITIEEQIQQIHKIQGLLPDEEKERIGPSKPAPGAPPMPHHSAPQPPPPPPVSHSPAATISAPPKTQPPLPPMPPQRPPAYNPPLQPVMLPPPTMLGPPQGILLPPPMLAVGGRAGIPFAHPLVQMAPMPDDEPLAKRAKQEDSLIPEQEFLRTNKSPVTFYVQIPSISDKPEWRLNGQMLTFTLPLTDTVSVLKAKIHEETNMPSGKQKLYFEGMFIKDSNSIAFYNITPNCTIYLQLKERGGRKK